jgi:hypothetical protein
MVSLSNHGQHAFAKARYPRQNDKENYQDERRDCFSPHKSFAHLIFLSIEKLKKFFYRRFFVGQPCGKAKALSRQVVPRCQTLGFIPRRG